MNAFSRLLKKVSLLFSRGRSLSDLDEEMAFHRAQAEKEFAARGMSPEETPRAAMRQFGNAMQLREQC